MLSSQLYKGAVILPVQQAGSGPTVVEPPARHETSNHGDRFQPSGGFYAHIAEAIAINKQRKPIYAQLTQGRSRFVSSLLINLERLSVLFALLYIDRQAARFNRQGIPIVTGDFAPMEGIKPATTPPRFTNRAGEGDFRRLQSLLMVYKQTLRSAIRAGDFARIGAASYDLLLQLDQLEESTRSHFCMAKHIVESIGLAALNAMRYAEMSQGQTVKLSKRFLAIQKLGLDWAASIDRKAQEIHSLGVGIIVNDIPDIPFKQQWEQSPYFRRS